jgi:hypothetical protein
MSSSIYIDYRTPDGSSLVSRINSFNSLDYARKRNEIGSLQLIFPKNILGVGITPVRDGRLEVYRSVGASAPYLDMETIWLITSWKDNDEKGTMEINAVDGIDILSRRIIPVDSGKAKSDKKKAAEKVMKEFVEENFGATSGTYRSLADYMSIELDNAEGPITHIECSWDAVLDALKDTCECAEGKGYHMSFDVVRTSPTMVEFRTYLGQRGIDRGQTSDSPLTVSNKSGSLANAQLEIDYTDEFNFVYVLGKGEGSNRVKKNVEDTSRSTLSPFARKEMVFEKKNSSKKTVLEDAGSTQLNKNRPVMRLSGNIVETPNSLYGIHYKYGDIVVAQFNNYKFDAHVETVRVQSNKDGETITSYIEGETDV